MVISAPYPSARPRRLRQAAWVRRLVAETALMPSDLILPLFLIGGRGQREAVASMPGVDRLSIDVAAKAAKQAQSLGIGVVALFPHTGPEVRDARASEALNPDNLVCQATRAIKDAAPDMGVLCDAALDPYTSHGHDGVLDAQGRVMNDATVEILIEQARIQLRAGCDIIAPSDMMDGRVGAIRAACEQDGRQDAIILSYAAKYASAFYGPFRDAIGSTSVLKGDKRTYQMDPANTDEALREIAADIREGADMVMVKPGAFYLDIIRRAADTLHTPIFAYQVSGEYAMIAEAIRRGWIANEAILESLLAFRRAGAVGVLTYFATEAAQALNNA